MIKNDFPILTNGKAQDYSLDCQKLQLLDQQIDNVLMQVDQVLYHPRLQNGLGQIFCLRQPNPVIVERLIGVLQLPKLVNQKLGCG